MAKRGTGNRKQQIARALDNMFSRDGIPRNPYLVSVFYRNNYFPINELLSLRTFYSLNATIYDIQSAINENKYLHNCLSEDFTQMHLPYEIIFTKLYVYQTSPGTTIQEMQRFIQSIDDDRISITLSKRPKGGFLVDFTSFQRLCACWRALKFIPFKGTLLQCEILTRRYEEKPKKSESIAPHYQRRQQKGPIPQRNRQQNETFRKQVSTPPPQTFRHYNNIQRVIKPTKAKVDLVIGSTSTIEITIGNTPKNAPIQVSQPTQQKVNISDQHHSPNEQRPETEEKQNDSMTETLK